MSWASSFFISLVDSAGNGWSNGLLHSAGGLNTACLSGKSSNQCVGLKSQSSSFDSQTFVSPSNGISTGTAVGAGLGGLGVGLVAGLFGAILLLHFRGKKQKSTDSLLDLRGGSHPGSPQGAHLSATPLSSHYQAVPNSLGVIENSLGASNNSTSFGNRITHLTAGSQYHVEPFVLPPVTEETRLASPLTSPTNNPSNPSLNASSSGPELGARPASSGRQVFVVHHDGGRAPVTVYTQEGTQVVELPPGYPDTSAANSTRLLQTSHLYAGHDTHSVVGTSSGVGRGSSDGGRTDVPGLADSPIALHQVRRPGNILKQGQPPR